MHFSAFYNTEKFFKKYCKENISAKKILDIGSYDINGSAKPIFSEGNYIGMDMSSGPNVDVVSKSHDIPFRNDYFDIVVSVSCLEHDEMFWVTFLEMCRVLKKGGYIYINVPSTGEYHPHPIDSWRFYLDSLQSLEKWANRNKFEIELVEKYIDVKRIPTLKDEQYNDYNFLHEYYHERYGNFEEPSHFEVWEDCVGIFKKII